MMADLGRERYWARQAKAKRYDRQTDTVVGRYLLREGAKALTKEIRAWLRKAKRGPGINHNLRPYFAQFKPGVVAFIAVRSVLDSIGRENSLISAGNAIGNMLEEEAKFKAINAADPRVWMDLKRRLKGVRSLQSKGRLVRGVIEKLNASIEPWPKKDKMKLGVILIEMIRQKTGLIDIQPVGSRSGRRRYVVVPTDATLAWMENSNNAHESMFPFWLPSLIPPLDWENPYDGGYHTNLVTRRPLVKIRDKNMLKELANADLAEVYKAVNILQKTAWEINPEVHEVMRHFWDNGVPIADLPDRQDEMTITRPNEADTDPDMLKAYRREVSMRWQRVIATRSRRVLAGKIMFMAKHFLTEKFYFPYQADFRGRLYTVAYFLQPQGPSQARGLLRFAEGRPLETPEAETWFLVHGANCFGVDKVSFEDRVQWVADNQERIMSVFKDPLDDKWWADASKPWEFLAWCLEFGRYVEEGPRFVSKIPIAMDGSNNGLQIFSLLLRDKVGAEATNCIPTERPRDIYQDVADIVTARLRETDHPMAAKWLEFIDGQLPRDATKRSVMTLPYGSTFHACIHYTRDWYEEVRKKRGGVTPFERGYEPSVYLARFIWTAITETVSSARECMDWLRKVSDIFTEAGQPVRWTSPSGFPVKQGYYKFKTKQIKTVVGNVVRFSNYLEDIEDVAGRKQKNGISPNFIHSLDAAALVKTVNLSHDAGLDSFAMIHDSYGVLAADAPKMAQVLREVYAEMFTDPILERFRDELLLYLPQGTVLPPIPGSGDLDVNLVKDSLYFFA